LVWPCTLDDFQRPRFTGLTIMPQRSLDGMA